MAAAAAGAVVDAVDADDERAIHPSETAFHDGRISQIDGYCPRCGEPFAAGAWKCADARTDRGCGGDLVRDDSTAGRSGGER
jgi:hypothetical protein